MTTFRDRTWFFSHPDFDTPEGDAGLQLSAHGGISMTEGNSAVRQALLLLISTTPGERIMRPSYGCNLHWLVFSPNDDTTAGLAIHYVRNAIERWEPRAEILRLDAVANRERPELLEIILDYRVRSTQSNQQLTFSLNLSGEDA
jgi:hypothetical protein